jgi:hypothetical protein
MVKHYSKRASKTRAYKKRRTIRKLRNTIRRKIHMVGGGPEEDILFKALFPLIKDVAFPVFNLLMKNLGPFLQIFILLGSATRQGGGSRISLNQRGGGLSEGTKQRLISILNTLKENFTGRSELVDCIDTLIAKFTKEPVDLEAPPPPIEDTIDTSVILGELVEVPPTEPSAPPLNENMFDKFKRIFNDKVKGTLNRKIENIKGKFTPEEYQCLITLKDAVLSDVVTNIRTELDKIKDTPLIKIAISTVEGMPELAAAGKEAAKAAAQEKFAAAKEKFAAAKEKFAAGKAEISNWTSSWRKS